MREGPWDVVVVGGGPSGSLTALLAARKGLSTLLVERVAFPRWKVCGACLNQAAQAVLREADLGHIPDRGTPLRNLVLTGWGRRAELPLEGTVALRRDGMDCALAEAAVASGAHLLIGTAGHLGSLVGDEGQARRLPIRTRDGTAHVDARLVIVASGLNGLRSPGDQGRGGDAVAQGSRIGVGAALPPETPGYEAGVIHMVTGDHGYVGLVRTEDGGLNVAGALEPDFVRRAGGPGPAVAAHLAGAGASPIPGPPLHGWRGTPALTRTPWALAGPRFLRLGDAAGYVEPFTGEGMAWALAGARAVEPFLTSGAGAWSADTETAWSREHRRRIGVRQRICRGIAWLSRRPGLARGVLGTVSRAPWLARPLSSGTTRPFDPAPTLPEGAPS